MPDMRRRGALGLALFTALVLAWAGPGLAGPGKAGTAALVEAMPGGQYYHRAGHLEVDGVVKIGLPEAQARGLSACPECSPPAVEEGVVKDRGASVYFTRLLERRQAGVLWMGVRGAPRAGPVGAVVADPGEAGAAVPGAAGGAGPAAPTQTYAERAAAAFPTEIPVPGTGGLLKVPTFKGTGAIVPVPLPMGGYFVVEPPLPGR